MPLGLLKLYFTIIVLYSGDHALLVLWVLKQFSSFVS